MEPMMPIFSIPAWILRFLGRSRYRIEAIERKEDHRRGAHHAVLGAIGFRRAEAVRGERFEVAGVERRDRERNECRERNELHEHENQIDRRALTRAQCQQSPQPPGRSRSRAS